MHRARRLLGFLLASALAVAAGALPARSASSGPASVQEVIGGFETEAEGWRLGLGNEFPGARGEFRLDSADKVSGERSGLLSGDFSAGGNYVEISRPVALDATSLRLWAKSAELGHLVLRMFDATGQAHQQRLALASGGGWQHVEVPRFDAGEGYFHFGGANDGVWHGPARRVMLILDKARLLDGRTSGQVRLDDITLTAEPPDLALGQVRDGNVFVGTEPAQVKVATRGDAVSWQAHDFTGSRIGSGRTVVEPGESMLQLPIHQVGYYRLTVTAEKDGATLATQQTTLARLAPFDTAGLPDSPFGMAAHLSATPDLPLVSLMAKAGVKNLREDAYWSSIEKTKGTYDFTRYDPLQQAVEGQGMRWLPIAVYTNQHYDNNATPYSDDGRAGFARYAAATTKHYGSKVKWMEVYNEFNIPNFGDRGDGPADNRADYYYPLLKATYEQVKAESPDTAVVGAVTAGVPLDWLEELFKLGGLKYMDVVSVHPYVYPAVPEQAAKSLADLKELIKRYNGGQLKPIWISEQGWPTHTGGSGVSEATQAAYLVRSHVIAFAQGVERYFWYDFMNDGLDPAYNENNFGVVRNTADPAGRWTPKPAYVSYATMTRQLTGADFRSQEQVGSGVSSFLFDKDGAEQRVLWSTEPTVVTVTTEEPVTVTDLTGGTKTYYPKAGQVQLSVSGDPLYLAGHGDVSVTGKLTLTAGNAGQAVTGEPVQLELTVDTTKAPRVPVKGTFEIAGTSVPVSVGAGQKVTIPVTVPAQEQTGSRVLVGDLTERGKPVARLGVRIQVSHPFGVTATHVLRDDAHVLSVDVRNKAGRELAVSGLTWRVGDHTGSLDVPSPVPAGETRTMHIPLAGLTLGHSYPSELRLTVPDRPEVVTTGRVVLPPAEQVRGLPKKSVVVDGVLDDLTGVPGIDLGAEGVVKLPGHSGTEDLSGKVWWTWDDQNIYLSARIHDNVHAQPSTGDRIWSGDGLQFSIGAGMPGESPAWYEYGVALTSAGPQTYRWLAAEGSAGPVSSVDLKVKRDEAAKDTVYELALPWSELAPFEPADRLMSLSFLVNDNDGEGRRGWIEWGSGIGGTKDPALFKPLRLDN